MANLQSSLKNREAIIQAVEEEIIGPCNMNACKKPLNVNGNIFFSNYDDFNTNYYWLNAGVKEEVLQQEKPSRRYAAGILYPLQVHQSEIEEGDLVVDNFQNENPEDFYTEENVINNPEDKDPIVEETGLDEIQSKSYQNDFAPSSMGLTFCLPKTIKKFKVKFSGGIYKSHGVKVDVKSDKEHKTEGKHFSRNWWLRETIYAIETISIKDTVDYFDKNYDLVLQNSVGEKIEKITIKLNVRCRRVEDYFLITTTVINQTIPPYNSKLNEYMIFQSQISILLECEEAFSNYPKAYQRNLPLSDDELNNELLFRNKANYAFGHNCSVTWNQYADNVSEVQTTFIPRYETESMTPDVKIKKGAQDVNLIIRMYELMSAETYGDIEVILSPLINGYEEWIHQKTSELQNLPMELIKPAKNNLHLCNESFNRMKRGLELLKEDKVLKAFKFANKAMLLQQVNGKITRQVNVVVDNGGKRIRHDIQIEDVTVAMKNLSGTNNSWRAFQIAYLLLSIQSIVEKDSLDRETVDLIWFPTGGGKTEAYLAVAAFEMFYRRILDSSDAGVDVIMRYTLRLLTADQFQRASRLICAMEFIRREEVRFLGTTPYSIGMWVGSSTSPNTNKEALRQLRAMAKSKGREDFVLTKCPWCGSTLGKTGKGKDAIVLGFNVISGNLTTHCPDKKCDFHNEIPVYFVDEIIYKKRPTFLIGTIDKFVQLTWKTEARSLFGIDKDGEREISPPQMIIQDELHLISGPLGTLSGLFETLVEELCIDDRGARPIKPKIISATATIKEFEEQAKFLFGRTSAKLFPSPGIDIEDSFFATVDVKDNGKPSPGRKYIGVFTSVVGSLMAQAMTYAAIMQKVQEFPEDEKDPFWTLLSFYNSLRDLGAGLNLFNSDIPTYIDALIKRENIQNKRHVGMPLELTSRKQSSEITKTIDDLNRVYSSNGPKNSSKVLSSCLASNIIEVGVDIDRLSLMGIIGQPKMTAQYIQVSGRVGRRPKERPGLITIIYSNRNSRDKSHYEHFNEYHQRLYSQVETTSLTPFSDASIDRGLSAVIIGFLRQRFSRSLSVTPDHRELQKILKDQRMRDFIKRINDRVLLVDPDQQEYLKINIKKLIDGILKGSYESWKVSEESRGLMYQAGNYIEGEKYPTSIPVIISLRSVDAESRGVVVKIDHEIEEFDWEEYN